MEQLAGPLIVLVVVGFFYVWGRSMGILQQMRQDSVKQILDM